MKKLTALFLILISLTALTYAQNTGYVNPFDGKFGLTLDGGAAIANTDFGKMKIGFAGRLGLEYFFYTEGKSSLGFRLGGILGQITAEHDASKGNNILDGTTAFPGKAIPSYKTTLANANLGLIYSLNYGSFSPYLVVAGASDVWYKAKTNDDKDIWKETPKPAIGWLAELGFKLFVSEGVSVNLAGAYHYAGVDKLDGVVSKDNDNYITGTAGFSFYFGGPKDTDMDGVVDDLDKCPNTPAGVSVDAFGCPLDGDNDGVADYLDKCPNTPSAAKVDASGCPLDADKDGVADYLDKCPNTPAGVKVDATGCPLDADKDGVADYLDKCPNTPAGVKVDATGCPLDTDKDGVTDNLDKCPNTPAGVKVDASGCPLDGDGDKVPDYLDKCPNTPKGAKVDADGCQIEITMQGGTTFKTGSSKLTDGAKAELKDIAKFIVDNPNTVWRVEGHTDNKGKAKTNKALSLARAKSVVDYLVSQGVKKTQLQAEGMGQDFPVASNDTEEGRAQNRRVVITKVK